MKIYYHNITKLILNESDLIDFMDSYEDGDKVFKSESGNACISAITEDELKEMKKEWEDFED